MIIQIMGLPGSGKTTLAKALLERVTAIHLNADDVRNDLNSDLGFSVEDRIENARRLGAMARLLAEQGHHVIVDFVNPTDSTRKAFGEADTIIWVDRIESSRFPDTDALWETPTDFDVRIVDGLDPETEVTVAMAAINL
jgi:adenylylsulfate kinase